VKLLVNFCITGGAITTIIASLGLIAAVVNGFEKIPQLLTMDTLETIGFFLSLLGTTGVLYHVSLRCPLRMYFSEKQKNILVNI
jgi:hypothetical protein